MVGPALITICTDTLAIQARYDDELSLQRAKRRWRLLFQEIFLIEPKLDFEFSKFTDPDRCFFTLTCQFKSQVGRYVFLRIQSDPQSAAMKTLKVAHYPVFPSAVAADEGQDSKRFLIKLLQYFQAGQLFSNFQT